MNNTAARPSYPHWPWIVLSWILIGLLAAHAPAVRAESVDAMAERAADLMRRVETRMSERDYGAANELIQKAGKLISKIEAKNPDHPGLPNLTKTRDALHKSLRMKQSPIMMFNKIASEAKRKKTVDSAAKKNSLNSLFRQPAKAPAPGASAEMVKRDVEDLESEYNRLKVFFDSAAPDEVMFSDLKPQKMLVKRMESFEKNDLPRLQAKLADFGRKYGASREEIRKRTGAVGYPDPVRAGLSYENVQTGIRDVARGRVTMAENLVRSAESRLDAIRRGHEFQRVDGYMEVFEYLNLAERFDPENQAIKDSAAAIGHTMDKEILAFSEQIDKRVWPGHAADAPENAETITSIALNWFKNSPEWGRREETPGIGDNESRIPLAVAISGPWTVEKKDASGKPLVYGLPVLLAVQLESEAPMGVSRVYGVTLRTRVSPDAKTRPAFDAAAIGPSCYFRPHVIK